MSNSQISYRKRKANETKEILFTTAMELFKKKGYSNVTVDEIVKNAGTSKGTFYTHFNSKEQVIVEEFSQIDRYYENLISSIEKFDTSYDKLVFFIESMEKYIQEKIGVELLRIVSISQLSEHKENLGLSTNRPLFTIIEKIISEGQKNGEFRSDLNCKEVTIMIIRCIKGFNYDWCTKNGTFDLVIETKKFLIDFIINNLKQ